MSWNPPNASSAPLNAYRKHVNKVFNQSLKSTQELQAWAVGNHHPEFWVDLYRYLEIRPPLPDSTTHAYDPSLAMSSVPPFFSGHLLNYAENVLYSNPDADSIALIGLREGQSLHMDDEDTVTWRQLRERVRLVASSFRSLGVKEGDRVAALMSNSIWTIAIFLACASRGIIFSSINPDLGTEVSRLMLYFDPHLNSIYLT